MSMCEICWATASLRAAFIGSTTQTDEYQKLCKAWPKDTSHTEEGHRKMLQTIQEQHADATFQRSNKK